MHARGHDVALIVGQKVEPCEWRGLKIFPCSDPRLVDGCDAVLSWNEPNLFLETNPGPLRVVNQQLNDFGYCQPGWEQFVDVVTSPSAHHLEFLKKQAPGVPHWEVLPNGCDPTQYDVQRARIPGRVIWASSADRGLHRLLEMWPEIKRRVPHASLRAFYNFQAAEFDEFEQSGPAIQPDLLEVAQRKRYIQYAMSRLAGPKWDVEHVGSVGRDRMRAEFEKSVVLAYPCDTIRYTEGFSVTTMEACASGCLPVITDIDSLGHIYGGAAPMVSMASIYELREATNVDKPGVRIHEGLTPAAKDVFIDLVVRGLTDDAWRAEHVAQCRALAERHSWPVLAARLEQILTTALAKRRPAAKGKRAQPSKALAAAE